MSVLTYIKALVTQATFRKKIHVQAALAIRGFIIRGFDYSRFAFCSQNLIFAGLF